MKTVAEKYPGVVVMALNHRSSKDLATRLKWVQAAMAQAVANPQIAANSLGV